MSNPLPWLLLLAYPLARLAQRHYQRVAVLPTVTAPDLLPPLSIIVPARDEADNLRRLLPSLQSIRYPGSWEVIVVDDGSRDDTALVAQEHGARLVRLTTLPAGWLGKPHACHEGARAATGHWLLFTDADTAHAPDGPARAVAYAQRDDLDGLSLIIAQDFGGWLEGIALLVANASLFSGLTRTDHLLYGSYILLRRDVYEASGGFAAVRHEPLEDLALGRRLRRQGFRVPLLRGEKAARVRMYADAVNLWRGLSRLSAGSLPWLGSGAIFTVMFTAVMVMPVYAAAAALLRRQFSWSLGLSWLLAAAAIFPWTRRAGRPWWALLAPLGAAVVQLSASWGLVNRWLRRGVRWKDRQA